jgi:hypothetical protein
MKLIYLSKQKSILILTNICAVKLECLLDIEKMSNLNSEKKNYKFTKERKHLGFAPDFNLS